MACSSFNSKPISSWIRGQDGDGGFLVFGPADPEDMPLLFHKVLNTDEGVVNSVDRMVEYLGADGDRDLGRELEDFLSEQGIMVFTAAMNEYAKAGKAADALHVFRMMPDERYAAPNA